MDPRIDTQDKVTGRQLRAARALLGWNREEGAKNCGVGLATLARLEGDDGIVNPRTAGHVARAFQAYGITFHDNDDGIGVSFRQPQPEPPTESRSSS